MGAFLLTDLEPHSAAMRHAGFAEATQTLTNAGRGCQGSLDGLPCESCSFR